MPVISTVVETLRQAFTWLLVQHIITDALVKDANRGIATKQIEKRCVCRVQTDRQRSITVFVLSVANLTQRS